MIIKMAVWCGGGAGGGGNALSTGRELLQSLSPHDPGTQTWSIQIRGGVGQPPDSLPETPLELAKRGLRSLANGFRDLGRAALRVAIAP
jgi:hypothetical protein